MEFVRGRLEAIIYIIITLIKIIFLNYELTKLCQNG